MKLEAVNELRAAIAASLGSGRTPTQIARDLDCSRGTVYKVASDLTDGVLSLDRRTYGNGHYSTWTEVTREVIMTARHRNPSWGPRMLYAHLARDPTGPIPREELPSPATIGRWLHEAGVARRPIGPRDVRHYPEPWPHEPGTVTLDGWGPWRIGDSRLYVCTAQDRYTRLAVTIPAIGSPVVDGARGPTGGHWAHALAVTVDHMLTPGGRQLRTLYLNNGAGVAPVSGTLPMAPRLALGLGARVVYIPPAQPWRNGRLERFHWTMETEYFRDSRPRSIDEAVVGLREWLNYFNADRPHSRLGNKAPGELAMSSPLTDRDLRVIGRSVARAPGAVECLRLVMNDGTVELWGGQVLRVPRQLGGQYVRVRFTVPGPGRGEVIYQAKGAHGETVATFDHDLDAIGRDPRSPLVTGVRLVDFPDDVSDNQPRDEERCATLVSRIQRRPSRLGKVLSGRAWGEDVHAAGVAR